MSAIARKWRVLLLALGLALCLVWTGGGRRWQWAEVDHWVTTGSALLALALALAAWFDGARRRTRLAHQLSDCAAALAASERALQHDRFALDQHAIVSRTDLDGNITFVNEKFVQISGFSQAELIGRNHRLLNSGLHPASFFAQMWHTISGGQTWQGVIRNMRKDGSYYWVVSTIVPELDTQGLPCAYFSLRTDITETLRIERDLERSEELYRLLAENTGDVVWLQERDGRITYASPSTRVVLGYDSERLLGADPWSVLHRVGGADGERLMQQALAGKVSTAPTVLPVRRSDGSLVWVEMCVTPLWNGEGKVERVLSTLRDVSARRAAEERLRLNGQAIEASPGAIVLVTAVPGYPVCHANPAFEQITGFAAELVLGKDLGFLIGAREDMPGIEPFAAAFRREQPARMQLQIRRRDGLQRWIDCSAAPIHDASGHLTHCVAAFSDCTERMVMIDELTRARDRADSANSAKSEFLARITHELRTPINFILGFAQLLETDTELLSDLQRDRVQRILRAGWQLRELVDEALDLARIESGKLVLHMEPVAIDAVVADCIALLESAAASRQVRFAVDIAPAEVALHADPLRLKQVLLNLLSNAVKFNCDGGLVTVRHSVQADGWVRVSVADSGPGIAPERLPELFQPFSRLDADRSQIPGSGIGPAISRRFVELMGGRIGADSTPQQGSVFWIVLPPAARRP